MLSADRKVLLRTTVSCSIKVIFVGSTSVSRYLDPCLQNTSLTSWMQSEVLLRYVLHNNCHQQIHFKTMKGTSIWYLPKPGSLVLNTYSSKSDMIKVKKCVYFLTLPVSLMNMVLYILPFSITLCCLR